MPTHSVLRLSTIPSNTEDLIEVFFQGVVAMQMKWKFASMTLSVADPEDRRVLLEFAELSPSGEARVKVLRLSSEAGGSGFVVCTGLSIWQHPPGSEGHGMPGRIADESGLVLKY